MRRLLLALLPVVAMLVVAQPAAATGTGCAALTAPTVPGAQVVAVAGVERRDHVVPPDPFHPEPIADIPAFCEVTLTLTHPGANDTVAVEVWLPLDTWNGRFLGTGGGGYAPGFFDYELAPAVKRGFAAVSTDAGVGGDVVSPAAWALMPDGRVNEALLTNFASRSVHDMTVAGKALTRQFYDRAAAYSYWNGCSTGGRQGLMEAQRFPHDYDGIVATAPAVNWNKFLLADQWPQVVMNEAGNFPTPCEFQAFNDAAVAACDRLDKVADGVIGDPARCRFDPFTLVGKVIDCGGTPVTVSRADAAVVAKIWAGPGVWSGLPRGAQFHGIAATTEDGSAGVPFQISDDWVRYFVEKDPAFDTTTVGYGEWYRQFTRSHAEYRDVIDTSDPGLSAFRRAGGKMITWHGQADELIFPEGSIRYWERVRHADDFYRLFLAPGVGHCGGGPGPAPVDPLDAVIRWVEQGRAPATLPAAVTTETATATRDLCRYPLVSRYDGHGDPNSAASFRCARSY